MADILSQSEIDLLLNSLSGDEASSASNSSSKDEDDVETKNSVIKEYNFARPPKFNKEQLRTLEIIFDNYARLVSSFLTGYLRTSTVIEVSSAEQLTYREFSNSLPNPVILSIFEMLPLKGSVILELSAGIGYSIIDRILGGPGLGLQRLRDFSEIEKVLIKRVVGQMLNYLIEPWENVVAIKPKLEKIETNPQFAQIISPNEMIALVSLKIKVGSVEGFMNFCIPHMVIESVMPNLNTRFWFVSSVEEERLNYKDTMGDDIEETDISVRSILGKTYISVNEFVDLQVGDVITLDSYVDSDLTVLVGDKPKFYGKPGIVKRKNAVLITGAVGKEN